MTMSMPRRRALLRWAERHDAAVIEDDYDTEFRYVDRPLEPRASISPRHDHVDATAQGATALGGAPAAAASPG
jgi:DNA-binding transcriptional MocR family regulator